MVLLPRPRSRTSPAASPVPPTGTLIFNRECADWLALTDDEVIEFRDLPISTEAGPMMKDFTGQILTFQDL